MAQQLSTGTFTTAKWIVSSDATQGTHTTIAGALTSASSGDTIFIRPGTYTENLTLKAGVNLTAFDCDAFTPNVTIIGKCSATFTGTCSISGIKLQTNSDFSVSITGTNLTVVNLVQCYILAANNVVLNSASSNAASGIIAKECLGDTTSAVGFLTYSGGISAFINCNLNNTANSTVASTITSTGIIYSQSSAFQFGFSINSATASSGIGLYNSIIQTAGSNTACITTAGSVSGLGADNTYLSSGTASAVSIGSGTTFILSSCTVVSSNTNAVTGLGTLTGTPIAFTGSSSNVNTTTQTPLFIGPTVRNSQQPAFLAYLTTTISNVTGDSTNYTIIYDTLDYDQNSNFNISTGVFTAPVTGKYCLTFNLHYTGATAITSSNFFINTTHLNYFGVPYAPGTALTTNGGGTISVVALMTAGDTAFCSVKLADTGGKVDDISGLSAGQPLNWFCGYLVC